MQIVRILEYFTYVEEAIIEMVIHVFLEIVVFEPQPGVGLLFLLEGVISLLVQEHVEHSEVICFEVDKRLAY